MSKPGTSLRTRAQVEAAYDRVMKELQFVDVHVHDMPDCMGPGFALMGPDRLIAYHYLQGEVWGELGWRERTVSAHRDRPLEEQVDFLAEHAFGRGLLPVSEAALGILTAAKMLGLPTESGDFKRILREWRTLFCDLGPKDYTDRIFELSGITAVVSTQDPFVPAECERYLQDGVIRQWDRRYMCGLRWDGFVHNPEAAKRMCEGPMNEPEAGGDLEDVVSQRAARHLLGFWIKRLPNVRYVALSLPGRTESADWDYRIRQALTTVIIPTCREHELPVVLMPFVRRGLNPSFGNAGDCAEEGDLDALIRLVAEHPEVNFLVTPLNPAHNYRLAFATRALPNLRVWGHWWGNLQPELIREQLAMRLQFNGYVHHGVNSDARVRDQLLFKWPHYWRVHREVIVKRCLDIVELSGWPVTEETIRSSIQLLQDHERFFKPPMTL